MELFLVIAGLLTLWVLFELAVDVYKCPLPLSQKVIALALVFSIPLALLLLITLLPNKKKD